MNYYDRLREYEKEKKKLLNSGISAAEYQKAIIVLARKWRI